VPVASSRAARFRSFSVGPSASSRIPEQATDAAKLQLSFGLADDDPEPDVRAEFRVIRETSGAPETLKTLRLQKAERPGWTDVEVPWTAHRGPVTLLIQADSSIRGEPATGPLDAPALVSEPVLVPDRLPPDPPVVLVYMVDTLRAHQREPLFLFFPTFQVHEYQATHEFLPEVVPDRHSGNQTSSDTDIRTSTRSSSEFPSSY
jgi:hypothetical protein